MGRHARVVHVRRGSSHQPQPSLRFEVSSSRPLGPQANIQFTGSVTIPCGLSRPADHRVLTWRSTPCNIGPVGEQVGIAALLRELRQRRGASLREAARSLNVDVAYLARVESGDKNPSLELQRRAGEYYGAADALAFAADRVPEDVIRILLDHPELLQEIRSRYLSDANL